MARITTVETGFYRIPLPVVLSDSTHGEITAFELITCRVRDADGAEGVGYTYTVGSGGAGPTYVSIDSSGRFLLASAFSIGQLLAQGPLQADLPSASLSKV